MGVPIKKLLAVVVLLVAPQIGFAQLKGVKDDDGNTISLDTITQAPFKGAINVQANCTAALFNPCNGDLFYFDYATMELFTGGKSVAKFDAPFANGDTGGIFAGAFGSLTPNTTYTLAINALTIKPDGTIMLLSLSYDFKTGTP